jgi:hypothetical protein
MALKLSALRAGRAFPFQKGFLVFISARAWDNPLATVQLEELDLKN